MSVPKKHHYLPEFFMQRWADAEGKVTEYRRPHENLVVKQKHPAATGYLPELYANTSKADPVERQALELLFMQKLDTLAADALAYLEAHGAKPVDNDLRSAWSRFLMSLMHRSPERVKYLVEKVRAYEEGTLHPDLKAKYDGLRGPNDPPTFEGWLEATGPYGPNMVVGLIQGLSDSQKIGPVFNEMRWAVHEVDGAFGFLTGDMPILISDGLGHNGSFVLLAIGPSRLFIGAHNAEVIKSFTKQSHNALQRGLNDACVRQSRHVIVGRGESQRTFVDRRFLKEANLSIGAAGLAIWAPPIADL
ncbi:MAG: DUF4238 domain-containing protein [Sphingomicrobium sp.]